MCEKVEESSDDEGVLAEDKIPQHILWVDFVVLSLHKPSIIDKNIFSLEKELFFIPRIFCSAPVPFFQK